MACSVWKDPCEPVIPWQMTRVFLPTRIDIRRASSGGIDSEPERGPAAAIVDGQLHDIVLAQKHRHQPVYIRIGKSDVAAMIIGEHEHRALISGVHRRRRNGRPRLCQSGHRIEISW